MTKIFSKLKFMSFIKYAPLLLGLTACVTTQEIAQNQARYDYNCDLEHLSIEPVGGGLSFKGQGNAFSVICSQPGNQWKALYKCETSIFNSACYKADYKKIEK